MFLLSTQIVVTASVSVCFKGAPHCDGVNNTSCGNSVDGAPCGAMVLMVPLVVTMLMRLLVVQQYSQQPPLPTELTLPFVAILLMALAIAQWC